MKLVVHAVVERQLAAVAQRPNGTLLLHGRAGVGKRTIAAELARRLNCLGCEDESCRSCRQLAHGNHPDVMVIEPDAKGKIGMEAVQELHHALTYQTYTGGSRVVIFDHADTLTLPAQNALLKTLEEPPPHTTLILTAETPTRLLDTVLSRCHTLYVPPVSDDEIVALLGEQAPGSDPDSIVALSGGAPGRALQLAQDPELVALYTEAAQSAHSLLTAEATFERLKLATALAAKPEREAYLEALGSSVRTAARTGEHGTRIQAVERLRQRLQANVNPKTAFEALAVELA